MKTWFMIGLMAFTFFWLQACSPEGDKAQELDKEVLAIHDEVMPRMDDIMSLQRKLTGKVTELDSLQQEGVSSTTLAEQRQKAHDLHRQLSQADSLMMEWMYNYRRDSALALSAQEAVGYFEKEKEKIKLVKEKTNRSISEAEEFLKE